MIRSHYLEAHRDKPEMMRIGIFQCAGGGLTAERRLAGLRAAILGADPADKPDLVLCPELFLSGYNVGADLAALAEPARGPGFERIAAIAADLGTAIVYGYPERGEDCIYNAAAFVSADGEWLANDRKQLNSPASFEEAYFTPGDRPTLLDYANLRIALLICYDVEFPEAVRNAALDIDLQSVELSAADGNSDLAPTMWTETPVEIVGVLMDGTLVGATAAAS